MNKFIILSTILLLAACGSSSSSTAPAPAATVAPVVAPVVASETRDSSQSISDIKAVQTTLTQQGFYHGQVDGIWGPATQNAVSSYQQANNLPVTGKLNAATLTALQTKH